MSIETEEFSVVMMLSYTISKADRHERPSRKPCWDGLNLSLLVMKVITCFLTTLSNIFIKIGVSEIGL